MPDSAIWQNHPPQKTGSYLIYHKSTLGTLCNLAQTFYRKSVKNRNSKISELGTSLVHVIFIENKRLVVPTKNIIKSLRLIKDD